MHPQEAIHRQSLLFPEHASSQLSEELSLPGSFQTSRAVGDLAAQSFWLNAAKTIDFIKEPSCAYGKSEGSQEDEWFPDSIMNTCYNALDRHVAAGKGDQICFQYVCGYTTRSTELERTWTYNQVLLEVKKVAAVLQHTLGVKKGDRIVIYMSMVPQAAFAMLACARLGAIHSVVFGGFSAKELAKRIDNAEAKVVIASSCGIEPKGVLEYKPIIDQAFQSCEKKPESLLIYNRSEVKGHSGVRIRSGSSVKEYDWKTETQKFAKQPSKLPECVHVKGSDPLYILYTSGTTALPKGVVRNNVGSAVCTAWCLQNTFGQGPNDVFACFSDVGWVVGHSFIVYGPLFLGMTSVFYEGKPITPDPGIWWRMVEKYKVTGLFTAPTALRAVKKEDPEGNHMAKNDVRSLRTLFLAGERSEPEIVNFYQGLLRKFGSPSCQVSDNAWSTESGSPVTARMISPSFASMPMRAGSAGLALPGMDVKIVDDDGKEMERGQMGNMVIKKPLAPSFMTSLWRDADRYQSAYFERFPGYFDTGDAGVIDKDGYISVLARTDDVMNVAGHRLSTSLIEQVVAAHPAVTEACVVGCPDEMKGHVPFALAVLKSNRKPSSAELKNIMQEINKHIREEVGAIAALGGLVATAGLPKTRSGKTLRRSVRGAVEAGAKGDYNFEPTFPPTIESVDIMKSSTADVYSYFKNAQNAPKSKL